MDYVKVSARFRPLLGSNEIKSGSAPWKWDTSQVYLSDPATGEKFLQLDHVFPPDSENDQVYHQVALPVVNHVLNGYNGTILCYGQTGSGKTHTIIGSDKQVGILESCVRDLFKDISRQPDYTAKVSYLEIYNENIYDLLQPGGNILKILRDDSVFGVILENLTEIPVASADTVMNIIQSGEEVRHYRSTNMNERSSRSHTLFRFMIERLNDNGDKTVSCISIVDLAGSERQSKSNTCGLALKEGGNINRSLLALQEVIASLADSKDFIQYRNSKLTRLLRQSLGGNSMTCLICTVTPGNKNKQESMNTLLFGTTCKRIKNHATKNQFLSSDSLLAKYKEDLAHLQHELQRQKEKNYTISHEIQVNTEEKTETNDVTRFAVRGQRWFRKKELQKLSHFRNESEKYQQEATKLQQKMDNLENTHNESLSCRECIALKGDRNRLYQTLESTFEKLETESHLVEELQDYCKSMAVSSAAVLPEERLKAIKKWECEMADWHKQSIEFNEETESRALLVEEEAEKLSAKKKVLDEREERLRIREQEVEVYIERKSHQVAACMISDFHRKQKNVLDTTVVLETKELELNAKFSFLGDREIAIGVLEEESRSRVEEMEVAAFTRIKERENEIAEKLTEAQVSSLEILQTARKQRDLIVAKSKQKCLSTEHQIITNEASHVALIVEEKAKAADIEKELKAKLKQLEEYKSELHEKSISLHHGTKSLAIAEEKFMSKVKLLQELENSLNEKEISVEKSLWNMSRKNVEVECNLHKLAFKSRENFINETTVEKKAKLNNESYRVLEAQISSMGSSDMRILEQRLISSIHRTQETLGRIKKGKVSEIDTFIDQLQLCSNDLHSPIHELEWIWDVGKQNCELRTENCLRQLAAAVPVSTDSGSNFFVGLADILRNILLVSIPLITAGEINHKELHFKRRLLSRHLSEAKLLLLQSGHFTSH